MAAAYPRMTTIPSVRFVTLSDTHGVPLLNARSTQALYIEAAEL